MGGGISIYHWFIVLFVIVLMVVPIARILKRAGFSGWWTLVWFIPLLNFVALWVFAFTRWPVESKAGVADLAGPAIRS